MPKTTKELVREYLTKHPAATSMEVTRYVCKIRRKPPPKYPLSGSVITPIKRELGIILPKAGENRKHESKEVYHEKTSTEFAREYLTEHPKAASMEISRYVCKKQGKPEPKHSMSGSILKKMRQELGIDIGERRSSAHNQKELIKECLTKNPKATYMELAQFVRKALGKPPKNHGLGGNYIGEAKKELGLNVKEYNFEEKRFNQHKNNSPSERRSYNKKKSNQYQIICEFDLENKEISREELSGIKKCLNRLRDNGFSKLLFAELADPKKLEIREEVAV